jgi:16S rRNA (uracil1498-N3)-methyltransferase
MVPRVYVPSLTPGGRAVALPADEADHLRRVLRMVPGSAVRVFDGLGHEYEARVAEVGRAAVSVDVGDAVAPAPECAVRIVLAQAVLKGDRIDDVIRDAVMMGVAAVQPMLTRRTDVPASAFRRGGRVERWQRIAVASAKQCGRAVVPRIEPPRSLADSLAAHPCDATLILLEPSAAPGGPVGAGLHGAPGSAMLLIGPEGGWAPEEVARALAAGSLPVSLGPRTLRADAAPLVALGVLLHEWGEISGFGTRDSGLGTRDSKFGIRD